MPSGRRHCFPRDRRLRKRREFLAVQGSGEKVHGTHFIVLSRPRETCDSPSRLGITVSRRVGGAVTRNRIKRLVREFVRQSDWLGRGTDVVVIAKRNAAQVASLRQVADELSELGGCAR